MGENLSGPEPALEPYREPPRPRPLKPRWRLAGRILWIAAACLLGLLLLTVGGGFLWLHTGKGSEELAQLVMHRSAEAIQGSLKVRAIHVSGFLRVCVDGLDLKDPDGHDVLRAERACVKLNPLALKAKRIWISEASLEKPWIEIAAEKAADGTQTTNLKKALAPAKPKPEETTTPSGTFSWTVDVSSLQIHGGSVAIRPGIGEPASFAFSDFELQQAHAQYAQDGGALGVKLEAQLLSPGKTPVALQLETKLDGPIDTGVANVQSLRAKIGDSGLVAAGTYDLNKSSGEVHLREIVVTPKDLAALLPPSKEPLLAGTVRGEADVRAAPKKIEADVRLDAGGGKVDLKAGLSLGLKVPEWSVQLALKNVDPGAVNGRAPHGAITANLEGSGKGKPVFDEHGVRGELKVELHVGPAQLERIGPVVADLKANLDGRYAIVRAFSATALGLELKAHGAAALDEVSLDLDLSAPSLSQVGRAVGALTKKPSLPLSGTMKLSARVTGAPTRPDAQLHVRAPWLRWGPNVAADGLAVDGVLHGELSEPDGQLMVVARKLRVGNVDLGAPRVDMGLEWPIAHLRIDAGVKGGALQLAGDATIDDDKDGLVLSKFVVAYPENQLRLAHDTAVHFRDEVIVEPLDLTSPHGDLRLSAQLLPARPGRAGRLDAALVVSKLDLRYLPKFALPPGQLPKGILDANAVVQGALPRPDVDVQVDVRDGGLQRIEDLAANAHLHAHLHGGRVRTDGWLEAPRVVRLELDGDVPLANFNAPAGSPVRLDLNVSGLSLEEAGKRLGIASLQKAGAKGTIGARLMATGSLAAPKATLSVDARSLSTNTVKPLDAHAGMLLDAGKATVDADVSLEGSRVVGLTAQAPFDLARALRDPAYLRGALGRPLSVDAAITSLELRRLAEAGLMPEGSTGIVSLGLHVGGTPQRPTLQLAAAGRALSVGRIVGLDFQGQLAVADDVRVTAGAVSQGVVVAHMDARAAISGGELVVLSRSYKDPDAVGPLLDRAVSMTLDIPGLPIARASQLAGRQKAIAEGKVVGHLALAGTPARPTLTGRLAVQDLEAQKQRLGASDLYLEADGNGALIHLGIDPPGGGKFLGHVQLKADLGARALLRDGFATVMDGAIDGTVRADKLDLAFLGGFAPGVRRAAGILDGHVKIAGTINKPTGDGEAHLHGGLFDIVGQGVFHDLGLDATFSPKEVVIDRLTGMSGDGTFSAILVAARRTQADGPDKLEFTGEVHLGDGESVRDRKTETGAQLQARPVPVRQAGDQRADVSGELDIFGDFTDGTLTISAKIPDARVKILALPDKKLPGLKEHPDVILVHAGERSHPPGREPEDVDAEEQARKTANFRVDGHLVVQHIYVVAPDFEFPVESDLRFAYDARDPDNPTADGTIHVPQGSFSALGRRFTIEDAKITETGGELQDPELEVKARYENPKATVTIVVSGTAKDPSLEMTSNPPMDQDAIAFFLATGRIEGRATQSGGGVDLSSAATSVLGSIMFGQLRKQLANVLPVDVLTIETGEKGVSQASVGKYIGDRVYIGYRARLTPAPGENTNEGRIEYEISKSVNAEATIGNANSDMSLMWTKDF